MFAFFVADFLDAANICKSTLVAAGTVHTQILLKSVWALMTDGYLTGADVSDLV